MSSFLEKMFHVVPTANIEEYNLEVEKAKLDIVTENMREGALLLDNTHHILFINTAGRVMLGLGRDENETEKILAAFKKKFPSIELEKGLSNATPGNPFHVNEIESDSEIYQIFFSRLPEKYHLKYKAYALIWIEDITEAKMLERRKSEFVSVVAHQLRTPLSGLKWTLHMLINGDFGELSSEQRTFLLKSYENNERMIALVNDMLAVDRIESGRMKYNLLRINLCDLIENVLFEVFPNAQKRKIKFDFVCLPGKQFVVLVDPSKIRAVLQNLLENSIKYTMEGGLVRVKVEVKGNDVEVLVQDSGIGIPKEQQAQIFKRFFRASNASKTEPSGTGLGLYMVKKIIELHGGRVWFESEENKGSTFHFTLPLVRSDEEYKKI